MMILLLSHVCINNHVEIMHGWGNDRLMFEVLKKYREILNIGENFEVDKSEMLSKITPSLGWYFQETLGKPYTGEDKEDKRLNDYFYEKGIILGSPKGSKLF